MFEAYFFDLDGTLVETAPEIADAVNDTLRYFDWPVVTQQKLENLNIHGSTTAQNQMMQHKFL